MQLSKLEDQFKDAGVNVIGVTYDAVKDLKAFSKKYKISYPLLHDDNAKLVKQFGIINTAYNPGDQAYGIPYPGMFLVNKKGIITHKFAEQGFVARPDFATVLSNAQSLPE